MIVRESYDVIVIGAGPAGSTTATLLADAGHSVLLLEKSRFPRHHIGESLMPHTYHTFKRIGMLDKLKASLFPTKESVQFVNAEGRDSRPYYFTDRDPHECSRTWQVRRDVFDEMMFANAAEHGVETHQEVQVRRVVFDDGRAVGVEAKIGETTATINGRVIVDATGMNTLLARQLDLRRPDPHLKHAAIYGYFRNAQRDSGRNAGATIVISTPEGNGWFWSIPLSDEVTSVGVVAPPAYLTTGRGADPARTLDEEIAKAPGIAKRLENAERVGEVRVTSDFSYRATRIAGPGWVLVGDAFGFLDPLYSSGVMLALTSGEMAADTIDDALRADDLSADRLGAFGPRFVAAMHLIKQLVHAFYDRDFSFSAFMKAHPEFQDHLVRILIGDVFNDEVGAIFDKMRDWTSLPEPMPLETTAPRDSAKAAT